MTVIQTQKNVSSKLYVIMFVVYLLVWPGGGEGGVKTIIHRKKTVVPNKSVFIPVKLFISGIYLTKGQNIAN